MIFIFFKEAGVLDTSGAEQEFLTYEYHVVYSASYAVPVLFFNIYKPGKRNLLDWYYFVM